MTDIRAARADLYARWGKTAAEQVHGMLEELVPEGRAAAIPPSATIRPGLWVLFPASLEAALRLDPTLTSTLAVDDTFKAAGTVHGTSPQLVGVVGKSLKTAVSMPLAFVVRVPLSHEAADGSGIKGEDVAAGLSALWERARAMRLPHRASGRCAFPVTHPFPPGRLQTVPGSTSSAPACSRLVCWHLFCGMS